MLLLCSENFCLRTQKVFLPRNPIDLPKSQILAYVAFLLHGLTRSSDLNQGASACSHSSLYFSQVYTPLSLLYMFVRLAVFHNWSSLQDRTTSISLVQFLTHARHSVFVDFINYMRFRNHQHLHYVWEFWELGWLKTAFDGKQFSSKEISTCILKNRYRKRCNWRFARRVPWS